MAHGSLLDSVTHWLVTSLKMSHWDLVCSVLGLSVLAFVDLDLWTSKDDITCTIIITTTFALN